MRGDGDARPSSGFVLTLNGRDSQTSKPAGIKMLLPKLVINKKSPEDGQDSCVRFLSINFDR